MTRKNLFPKVKLSFPYVPGTLLTRTRKDANSYTKVIKRLLVLEYIGKFRESDPFDAAYIYECLILDTGKENMNKLVLYDFWKQNKAWNATLPE